MNTYTASPRLACCLRRAFWRSALAAFKTMRSSGVAAASAASLRLRALSAALFKWSSCREQQLVTFNAHAQQGAASAASLRLRALSAALFK